jgi:hypothetical protein
MSVGTLSTMGSEGDTKIEWDSDNPGEVAAARAHFDALRREGHVAYRDRGGDDREVIREFPEQAERVVMVPQLQGG